MTHSDPKPESKPSSSLYNSKFFIWTALLVILIYVVVAEFNLSIFFLEHGAFDKYNEFFDADPHITLTRAIKGQLNLRHPLILAMLFPILKAMQFLNAIPYAEGIVLITTLVSAVSVLQFYFFSTLVFKERLFSFGMALLFAFSFSTVFFTVVPDSFVLAQASIGLMYLVFFLCYYEKRWRAKTRFILIVLTGVIVAGITITNGIAFFITLTVFEIAAENSTLRKSFFRILSATSLVIGLLIGLFFLQFIIAPHLCNSCSDLAISSVSPYFEHLVSHGSKFSVKEQAEFTRQLYGLPSAIKNMFFPTTPIPDFKSRFSFNQTNFGLNNLVNIVFSLFIMTLIFLGKELRWKSLWLSLFLSLVFNLIFHTFFGDDFFLYTQHFAFQLFFLLAFSLIRYYRRNPLMFSFFLFLVIVVELLSTKFVLRFLMSNY